MYCRWDNKCYLKATIYQQQAISYFTTLVTRIKSAENYKDEFPVVFVNRQEIQDQSLKEFPQFEDVKIYPYAGIWDYVNDYAWQEFMRIWCGYAPEIIESEVYEGLPQIKEMTSYPDDGSIKVIDQTVVVKF